MTNVPSGAALNRARLFVGFRPIFGGVLSQRQVDCLNAILDAGTGTVTATPGTWPTSLRLPSTRPATSSTCGRSGAQHPPRRATRVAPISATRPRATASASWGAGSSRSPGAATTSIGRSALALTCSSSPSLAEGHDVAARILVEGCLKGTFTGKKLSDYPSDFVESRRVVNGADRATLIAGYAYRFLDAIESAQEPAQPTPAPAKPLPAAPQTPASEPRIGFWQALLNILLAIIGRKPL